MKRNLSLAAFFAALFLFSSSSLFAEVSVQAQKLVDDFMAVRMKIAGLSSEQALAQVGAFEKDLEERKAGLSQEDALVLENFIVMEKYNFMRKKAGSKDFLKKTLKALKEKNAAWFLANSGKAGKWLLATSADVTSCYMSYSLAEVVKSGMALRDKYKESVAKDPGFSYGWTNLAQWYYWAPAINGGSGAKARDAFENAVSAAKTPAEKFFACVFYSQFLFEKKELKKSAALLDEAESQDPENPYVAFMRQINAAGDSFFEWNKKHSQMEKDK